MSDSSPNPQQTPSFVYATTRDWDGYFRVTSGRPPRETLLGAIELFENDPDAPDQPVAVDFGCGEGRDTARLINSGWRVHAIDGHPNGIRRLLEREDLEHPDQLTTELGAFESIQPPLCDLLNASYSLPFCRPDSFDTMWSRIVDSIRPGGRFCGQFFGDRHSWASIGDRSHHTRGQVDQLLARFDVESLKEEDREGQDCSGIQMHWHVFHVIARKQIV